MEHMLLQQVGPQFSNAGRGSVSEKNKCQHQRCIGGFLVTSLNAETFPTTAFAHYQLALHTALADATASGNQGSTVYTPGFERGKFTHPLLLLTKIIVIII
jgi:hypothetical protein